MCRIKELGSSRNERPSWTIKCAFYFTTGQSGVMSSHEWWAWKQTGPNSGRWFLRMPTVPVGFEFEIILLFFPVKKNAVDPLLPPASPPDTHPHKKMKTADSRLPEIVSIVIAVVFSIFPHRHAFYNIQFYCTVWSRFILFTDTNKQKVNIKCMPMMWMPPLMELSEIHNGLLRYISLASHCIK